MQVKEMSEALPDFYDVVGIDADGRRHIVECGFSLHDAEQCRQLLEKSGIYPRVVVERAGDFDPPPKLYRLIGLRLTGEWVVIHEAVPAAQAEQDRDLHWVTGQFSRLVIEPTGFPGIDPSDPRD
jgi:hypothetical protein